MRAITSAQLDALDRRDTRPIYLIELYIDGDERYSTNGHQAVGLVEYAGADIGLASIDNWASARIKLLATPARVAQLMSQAWRHGYCRVYLLPVATYPRITQPGYVQAGYGVQGDYQSEPILLVDGELTAANLGPERCEFTVSHRVTVGRWLPALRIDPPLCNHLPRHGEVVVWENEKFTLEAR
ncbi:MAG: hypothetical protein Q8N13_10560 [Acidovorax sp.]|nr:hypothetical protein [Acidovorax sp.]